MNAKNEKITQLIKQKVSEVDPEAEVILYGSRARGDERVDSDWDIIVLTEYDVNHEIEKQFWNALYDLELELEEVFSVIIFSRLEWETKQKITPFYDNVSSEGIKI